MEVEPSQCCCRKSNMMQPLWKTIWHFLKKLNILLPYDPTILLLGIYAGGIKASAFQNVFHTNDHSILICNNPNLMTIQLSINV